MGITVQPILGSTRLHVSGDIETVLQVPFDDDDRFFVGLGDGTLLLGTYDEELRCSWSIARDGAGIVRIESDRVNVEWAIEWVTAGLYDPMLLEPAARAPLPLFPDLDQLAA